MGRCHAVGIFQKIKFLVQAINKLEDLLSNMLKADSIKRSPAAVNMNPRKDSEPEQTAGEEQEDDDFPTIVLAPLLMMDQRLFPPLGDPGGWDHAKVTFVVQAGGGSGWLWWWWSRMMGMFENHDI